MQLKEKRTGKLIEPEGCIINGPGFTISLEAFAEQYEIVSETEKPFEEVAEPKYRLELFGETVDEPGTFLDIFDEDKELDKKKLFIADRDYYEILPDGTRKTQFTWDEAMEIEKKTNGKWRLPTEQEWFAICTAFGKDEDGRITGDALAKNLGLMIDSEYYGYFWSRSADSELRARLLCFCDAKIIPQTQYSKTEAFSVRLVRGGEK